MFCGALVLEETSHLNRYKTAAVINQSTLNTSVYSKLGNQCTNNGKMSDTYIHNHTHACATVNTVNMGIVPKALLLSSSHTDIKAIMVLLSAVASATIFWG